MSIQRKNRFLYSLIFWTTTKKATISGNLVVDRLWSLAKSGRREVLGKEEKRDLGHELRKRWNSVRGWIGKEPKEYAGLNQVKLIKNPQWPAQTIMFFWDKPIEFKPKTTWQELDWTIIREVCLYLNHEDKGEWSDGMKNEESINRWKVQAGNVVQKSYDRALWAVEIGKWEWGHELYKYKNIRDRL